MRAVVVDKVGRDGVPRVADVPTPDPSADQVAVRMQFASVNPADWKCLNGWMTPYPQFQPRFPFVLGFDGVGVVTAVGTDGRDGTDVRVGDRVCVRANQMTGQHGTFAETVCVARSDTAPIPDEVPGWQAATIPVAGVTAYQSITRHSPPLRDRRVLVNGAAGGVGSYAVQLAVLEGAHVAGTCGPDNTDYLAQIGCEHVVNYRDGNIRTQVGRWAPDGLDVLLDTVHLDGVPDVAEIVRAGGTVVGIVTLGPKRPYDDAELRRTGRRFVEATVNRAAARADMIALGRLLADGRIRPPAIEVLPFDAAPDALARVQAGHVRGKIVLAIGE
jgi:NADPH:quinone reductase-like Zn-dependent oxidoreductase